MLRAIVDFPDPDSPTMPRMSPAYRVSETWSTARLGSRLPGTRKYWHRSSSTSSGVCTRPGVCDTPRGAPVAAMGGIIALAARLEGTLISPLPLRALVPAVLVVEPAGHAVPGNPPFRAGHVVCPVR